MYVLTCILVKLLWIALLTNQSLYVYRWLNGFNDNLSGFPRLPCKYIPCSPPYMGDEQPGAPVDASKALQGPYGTGAFVQCDFVFCIVWYELLLTRLVIRNERPNLWLVSYDERLDQRIFWKPKNWKGLGYSSSRGKLYRVTKVCTDLYYFISAC